MTCSRNLFSAVVCVGSLQYMMIVNISDTSCLSEIDSDDTNLTLTPPLLFDFIRKATA